MPWIQTEPMTERAKFIIASKEGCYSMTELCERFSISRKTGYKWINRYEADGLQGLSDQSRAPRSHPHRVDDSIRDLLIECRRKHPTWGARKIISILEGRRPDLLLPAASTITEIFGREGLLQRRHPRKKYAHPGAGTLTVGAPNEVWTADFKGEFRMKNRQYCYPLTIADAYSRFLLACQSLSSTAQKGAFPVFKQLFQEYGLPQAIRTDNGVPFSTSALCGLSRLSVWWTKLGIHHQRIDPGKPEQNGRHERMHRTLKAETTRPPEINLQQQQIRFECFREEFNNIRPHEALGQKVPASEYSSSTKALPRRTPKPNYASHHEVRLVSDRGSFKFKTHQIFLSLALVKEQIALEEIDDGIWRIYFYDLILGHLNEHDYSINQ
jgi:putative transposase